MVMQLLGATSLHGVVPMFMMIRISVKQCWRLLALRQCQVTVLEEWCGLYASQGFVPVVNFATGEPVLQNGSAILEPGLVIASRSICSKHEDDMKNSLTHDAVGVNITGQRFCRPEEGLPAGTMCTTFTGPGVDPDTGVVRRIAGGNGGLPGIQLTAKAKKSMDIEIAKDGAWPARRLNLLYHRIQRRSVYHCMSLVVSPRQECDVGASTRRSASAGRKSPSTGGN